MAGPASFLFFDFFSIFETLGLSASSSCYTRLSSFQITSFDRSASRLRPPNNAREWARRSSPRFLGYYTLFRRSNTPNARRQANHAELVTNVLSQVPRWRDKGRVLALPQRAHLPLSLQLSLQALPIFHCTLLSYTIPHTTHACNSTYYYIPSNSDKACKFLRGSSTRKKRTSAIQRCVSTLYYIELDAPIGDMLNA